MQSPWQRHFQVGVVHFMLFPECLGGEGPLLATLQTIVDDPFFEAVDVGPMVDAEQRAACASLLRLGQLSVTFACQPLQLRSGLDLNAADAAARQHAVAQITGLIPQAKELGACRFGLMSGRNVPTNDRSAALDRLVDSLRVVCRAARERAGLPVMLEIFDHDVDKKALVGSCTTAAWVAKEVRRDFPDFGLLHDLSHIYLCHEDPAKHFPLIAEYLVAMHAGNSVSTPGHPQFGDTHPPFGWPGGDADVAELRNFLKVLFDIGYLRPDRRPVIGFELKPPLGTTAATMVANMKRTLTRAWWDWPTRY
jgi:sugar phosphate isomerase/epimerase